MEGIARRILIVEDDDENREAMRVFLEYQGHTVREAADGRRGLMLAISWQPDVVCLDLALPLMDGYEVARSIVAAFGSTHRPWLVAVTGLAHPNDRERATACGFDGYVVKPFEAPMLDELLSRPLRPAGRPAGGNVGAA